MYIYLANLAIVLKNDFTVERTWKSIKKSNVNHESNIFEYNQNFRNSGCASDGFIYERSAQYDLSNVID